MTVLLRSLGKLRMTREKSQTRRRPFGGPNAAGLTRDEMADYVRLCELGQNLERASARWAREQAHRDLPSRQRRGGGIVLAAVVIGLSITLLALIVRPRLSGRPRLPPSLQA